MVYASNPIDELMLDRGNVPTNDASLRAELEYFVPYLRTLEHNRYVELGPVLLARYRHDLNGLLRHLNVDENLYWITMRVNKLAASTDLDERHTELIIPDGTEFSRIVNTILSNRRKKN